MDDLKNLMKDNYVKYASYVIMERAIPDALDGLKPVQRRILHALKLMHDGKLHKVANVVGQTMAYHPHGDNPIYEALVNLANKGFLLERQGNFGNPHTGDPAAAARYIETRLSPLSLEALFMHELTDYVPSYDGRKQEPIRLPSKVPLLLLQGAEGIAVGMATRIFSHNFLEVLEAEIAHLKGEEFTLLPDFSCGGIIDVSQYEDGKGKIRMRAKIEIEDPKTLRIKEICYGTTTESVIQSIDEAAKKGKIKLDSIHDYTAENVDIEIKLPRGQYAEEVIDALYALTSCEVSITPLPVVIYEDKPCETTISKLVSWHAKYAKEILTRELNLEKDKLLESIFAKSLERIFIENKIYRDLEKVKKEDELYSIVEKGLKPFHKELARKPNRDDIEKLLKLPVRRISRFDLDENKEAIAKMEARIEEINKHLKNMKAFTIRYFQDLIKRYKKDFPRRSKISKFEQVSAKEVDLRKYKMGLDLKSGYIGTKVSSPFSFDVKPHEKVLVFLKNGTYRVIGVEEKVYVKQGKNLPIWAQVVNPETTFTVVYTTTKREGVYAKRFKVERFIMNRDYQFLSEDEKLKAFSLADEGMIKLKTAPTSRRKEEKYELEIEEVPVKGFKVKGVRLVDKKVKSVSLTHSV